MNYQILQGDCIQSLRKLPDQSVNCCVTSPPYYALRDYGVNGQIGLEQTPEEYINKLVEVFREVKRVLRDDGTIWINIADTYAGSGKGAWNNKQGGQKETYIPDTDSQQSKLKKTWAGIKPKDLIGIPWMLAFALREDGWYLRQDVIWHKTNPMPESVKDRCTKAHEYMFLLSKSQRYYYDHHAIKEPSVYNGPNTGAARHSIRRRSSAHNPTIPNQTAQQHREDRIDTIPDGKRNKRSVWTLATKPFIGAHFATFPPALIEPCILAGCPVGGTVIDPFGGSGTVAGVAIANHRRAILCELNPDYIDLVPSRISSIINKNQPQRAGCQCGVILCN